MLQVFVQNKPAWVKEKFAKQIRGTFHIYEATKTPVLTVRKVFLFYI